MKIKLLELTGEEQSFQWEVPSTWIAQMFKENAEEDELEAGLFSEEGSFQLDAWVYRSDQDIFFRAQLIGLVKGTCVRCLEPLHWPVDLEISGVYGPRSRSTLDESDDPSHYFYTGDEIDFSDAIREHLFMNLPLNPSCELAGLDCASGTLQETFGSSEGFEEETKEPVMDKRWNALLKIKESMKKEE